jgi:hypothetical protein
VPLPHSADRFTEFAEAGRNEATARLVAALSARKVRQTRLILMILHLLTAITAGRMSEVDTLCSGVATPPRMILTHPLRMIASR